MNNKIFIAACLLTMFTLLLLRCKKYKVHPIKTVPMTIAVAAMGLLGTYIMFFIENGGWYGRSFFGALLFYPILLLPVAFIFRMRLEDLLDFATPPGLAILALYKYNCYMDGCCAGKAIWFTEEGIPVYFPSQLAEMVTALLIMLVVLLCEKKEKNRGTVYPVALIIYGVARYILNFFRWEQSVFLLGMAPGNFWSICSAVFGIVLLIIKRTKGKTRNLKL